MTNINIPANLTPEAAKQIQAIIDQDIKPKTRTPRSGDVYMNKTDMTFVGHTYLLVSIDGKHTLINLKTGNKWTQPQEDITKVFSDGKFEFIGLSKDVLKVTQ